MAKHLLSFIDQPVEVVTGGNGCDLGGSLQVKEFLKGLTAEGS